MKASTKDADFEALLRDPSVRSVEKLLEQATFYESIAYTEQQLDREARLRFVRAAVAMRELAASQS